MLIHHLLRTALLALCCWAVPAAAAPVTLDFEDLPLSGSGMDTMPGPYNGLMFSGWYYGEDTVFTPKSGRIDLFTDFADPAEPYAPVISRGNSIAAADAFVLDGAWFSGYSGVFFELWHAGQLVHTSLALPDAAGADFYGPTYLASGYAGAVDRVVVAGVQGFFAMDDLRIRSAQALPLPATPSLVLLALALCALARRPRFLSQP